MDDVPCTEDNSTDIVCSPMVTVEHDGVLSIDEREAKMGRRVSLK